MIYTPPVSEHDSYQSPLSTRFASPEMQRIWSARHKFDTWRRIWLAVAEAQHEVTKDWGSKRGPSASEGSRPLVTKDQVEELRTVVERGITDEEITRASEIERDLRHDVMSHVHCLGEQCPKAKPIIHLGMTSQDVVCNADLILLDAAARLVAFKVGAVVLALCDRAGEHKSLPTLGFTHYQAAQPLTVGRRCAQWAHDLEVMEYRVRLLRECGFIRFRGFRGATGTQASYLALFDNDPGKVDAFEKLAVQQLARGGHYAGTHGLMSQTYPRFIDTLILGELASVASVLHKIATDIRLLVNLKELDEPFGSKQIGSSAMPYKRNPMRCERICGLARFVMNLVGNAYQTAATQWLERTLDDSSNRRLSLPEAFLALDGALDLMHNVASGLVVHEAMVRRNLMGELPFLATENILMEAVKAGGDRQDLHEKIRVHAQAAGARVKDEGLDNDLLERLKGDPAFAPPALTRDLDWDGLMDPMRYVGRAVEQTERFIAAVVEPLRERYADELENLGDSEPRV